MKSTSFTDYRTMPAFEDALRDLIGTAQHYVEEISPLCEQGDIPIFCHLVSTLFINGLRYYIESLRAEKNDHPQEALNCYKQCVDILTKQVSDKLILNVFKNPPEEWIGNTTRV